MAQLVSAPYPDSEEVGGSSPSGVGFYIFAQNSCPHMSVVWIDIHFGLPDSTILTFGAFYIYKFTVLVR